MALTQITTNGIKDGTITGTDLTTNIDLVDNQKLRLGTGNDLEIYHDGSNSYIKEDGTGSLLLWSTGTEIKLLGGTGAETLADFNVDGAVELYHNGTKKFETTSGGVEVTGKLTFAGDGHTQGIELGADADIIFYHDNSNGYLDNNVGDLYLRNDGNSTSEKVRIQAKGGEQSIVCNPNGAVELYHDNSKKFQTDAAGVIIYGNLYQVDNDKLMLGNTSDLQIYHDGTNSVINNTTNDLRIESDRIELNNQASNEFYLTCTANGAVELYYDNDLHFATTANGVKTNGNLSFRGDGDVQQILFNAGDGSLQFNDNTKLKLGASDDLQIYHDGTDSKITNSTGNLIIDHSNGIIRLDPKTNENGILIRPDGAVELYHDGSKEFETTSNGVKITGNGHNLFFQAASAYSGNAVAFLDSGSSSPDGRLQYEHSTNEFLFETGSSWRARLGSTYFKPQSNNAFDLGTSSQRFRNVYTNDLNLSNEGGSNDVDGTWGSYTIQEGAEDLFLVNKRSGKKYKFNLTEVS